MMKKLCQLFRYFLGVQLELLIIKKLLWISTNTTSTEEMLEEVLQSKITEDRSFLSISPFQHNHKLMVVLNGVNHLSRLQETQMNFGCKKDLML